MVENLADGNSKVDRMWERLLEIVLFCRTSKHRKPVEVLKSFIGISGNPAPRISQPEKKQLRTVFQFLKESYQNLGFAKTRLATDQTHFYTMVTSLIGSDVLEKYERSVLAEKLFAFGSLLDEPDLPEGKLQAPIKKYRELAARQTTDVARREERQKQFLAALDLLSIS